MAKIVSEKQINAFVKGIITEASPLTYPENASLDEENFDLEKDGSRKRRLGMDYEVGYSLIPTGFTEAQLQTGKQGYFDWNLPGGSTTVSFGVIRIGDKLWFINKLSSAPSSALMNSGNSVQLVPIGNSEIDTTVINGYLIIVCPGYEYPFILTYDPATDTVSSSLFVINVRDFWGVYDSLTVTQRPTTLDNTHKYNLRNQGWSEKITSTCGTDAIDCTFTTKGEYPSNADIWTLGKVGDATSADFEKYDPNKLYLNSIDNSISAKGSIVISPFQRGFTRMAATTLGGLPLDRELGSFTTVTSFAGRAFYSGIVSNISSGDANSPNLSNYIFFSQVVTNKEKLSYCYQEADPTSQNISDIIDTDGGTIQIPEISRVIKLIGTRTSLFVFAENGIWEITGDNGGFTATSFTISKLSNVGISNPKAVVDANGIIFFWSSGGICVIDADQNSGRFAVRNLSMSTIQTKFFAIPEIGRRFAKGFFDEIHNHVYWMYNDSSTYSESNYINHYTKILNLDLNLQAFYLYSISSLSASTPRVFDFLSISGSVASTVNDPVYIAADPVIVGIDPVVVSLPTTTSRISTHGFMTLVGTSFTVSKFSNDSFKDWVTADGVGVDFTSYLITGYDLMGDILRYKQVPSILFYFKRTEDGFTQVGDSLEIDHPSGCTVQAQWNWANSAASGKWGTTFQAYRLNRPYIPSGPLDTFDYGDGVIVTKNKLRGSGRCLSLKIQSDSGKDTQLLGWALEITGDSKP